MEINGIAHIFLTASNYQRSREFYRQLLPFLGLKRVMDNEGVYYCVGGRTGVAIRAPSPEHAGAAFEQSRVGLHHLCFRARERADVDDLHAFLGTLGAKIIRAARGPMGAGLLFIAVRGSRRHPAGAQPCAGEGAVGVRDAFFPSPLVGSRRAKLALRWRKAPDEGAPHNERP
jgi:catechol 2,3-dioxygenase-like lactoylglutathione lyase family enzyme